MMRMSEIINEIVLCANQKRSARISAEQRDFVNCAVRTSYPWVYDQRSHGCCANPQHAVGTVVKDF